MTSLVELENAGFRFALDGGDVVVRHYSGSIPPDAAEMLADIDKQELIHAINDRAAGFIPADGEQIEVPSALLPAYCAAIRQALDDGRLWDARAVYHRSRLCADFYLMPPGVIQL